MGNSESKINCKKQEEYIIEQRKKQEEYIIEQRKKEDDYDREQSEIFNSIFDDEISILRDEGNVIIREIYEYRRNQSLEIIYDKDLLKKIILNTKKIEETLTLKEKYNKYYFKMRWV
jgi:hypothetical protein